MTKLQVYRTDQMNVWPVDPSAFPRMANQLDFYLKSDVDALLPTMQQPEPTPSQFSETLKQAEEADDRRQRARLGKMWDEATLRMTTEPPAPVVTPFTVEMLALTLA